MTNYMIIIEKLDNNTITFMIAIGGINGQSTPEN